MDNYGWMEWNASIYRDRRTKEYKKREEEREILLVRSSESLAKVGRRRRERELTGTIHPIYHTVR